MSFRRGTRRNLIRKIIIANAICLVFFSCGKGSKTPTPIVVKPPDTIIKTPDTTTTGPLPVVKANSIKIYAHYLPWFETPATSPHGKWGQHWAKANENPDVIGNDGKRQIASYFYPMTGPYASSDRDILD